MKVSIVVPVYNTEDYLTCCINSILRQTFYDYELLLVDDGSTDGSGALCDSYQERDGRVRVFHQQNGGVSAARNFGVQQAQGEWICYVDSDDEVKPDYLKEMVEAICSDHCMVMGNISDGRMCGNLRENTVKHGKEMVRYLLDTSALFLSGPVAKLFNRELLIKHGICFPEGIHYGEDMVYLFTYLNVIEDVAIRKDINYIVRMRADSLTRGYYSFESEHACFQKCLEQMTHFVGRLDVSPEEQKRLVWSNKIADAFIRCPKCLYAGNQNYSFREKIQLLQGIPADYYCQFGKWFRPQGFSSRVITSLIRRRQFFLLLIVGSMYEKARKMKN
ncbi:MAG: glycosyltransferase family 2 protein [Prevotella sp.]|nr:glycosyltransferase family 2 protein [Prevotella sp.]